MLRTMLLFHFWVIFSIMTSLWILCRLFCTNFVVFQLRKCHFWSYSALALWQAECIIPQNHSIKNYEKSPKLVDIQLCFDRQTVKEISEKSQCNFE